MIPAVDFDSSELALVCTDPGCRSLGNPALDPLLSTWSHVLLPSGCACVPGAGPGGAPGAPCFRPERGCQGGAGLDVCSTPELWCTSGACVVPSGETWGRCL